MTNPGSPSRWRNPILVRFTPEIATVARLTIVSDPDRLLTEETILDRIDARGFDLVPFEDHVAFATRTDAYRRTWDRGDTDNFVVILHTLHPDVANFFDLLESAQRERRFSVSVGRVVPRPGRPLWTNSTAACAIRCSAHSPLANAAGSATTRIGVPPRHVFDCSRADPNRRGATAGAFQHGCRGRRLPPSLDAWLIARMDRTRRSPAGPWRGSSRTGRSSSRSFRSGGPS